MPAWKIDESHKSVAFRISGEEVATDPVDVNGCLVTYQLVRKKRAEGSVSVQVTNDPRREQWFEVAKYNREAFGQIAYECLAVRFVVEGNVIDGLHLVYILRS